MSGGSPTINSLANGTPKRPLSVPIELKKANPPPLVGTLSFHVNANGVTQFANGMLTSEPLIPALNPATVSLAEPPAPLSSERETESKKPPQAPMQVKAEKDLSGCGLPNFTKLGAPVMTPLRITAQIQYHRRRRDQRRREPPAVRQTKSERLARPTKGWLA